MPEAGVQSNRSVTTATFPRSLVISVTPKAGGEPRTTTTGPVGEYRVEALNPGPYRVAITAAHFANQVIEDFRFEVDK